MALTYTIGSETANIIPEADRVRCRLIDIADNKYQPDTRLDFTFQLNDPDYDNEDMDDSTIETIRAMSRMEQKHYERVNKPPDAEELSKGLKIYKYIKWFSGRDIETGENIDLEDFKGKDYFVDFHHVDKKGGPPDFAVARDDKGNPVQKAEILKFRPANRQRKAQEPSAADKMVAALEPAPRRGRQAALPETDDDLFDDTDE